MVIFAESAVQNEIEILPFVLLYPHRRKMSFLSQPVGLIMRTSTNQL